MARKQSIRFDPSQKGLAKIFGSLEAEVMEVMWRKGRATVAEVVEVLRSQREIAYTTVMTIMSRLAEKGVLRRSKVGQAYSYTPTATRQEFLSGAAKRIVDGLLEDFRGPTVQHIIERLKGLDKAALKELESLLGHR